MRSRKDVDAPESLMHLRHQGFWMMMSAGAIVVAIICLAVVNSAPKHDRIWDWALVVPAVGFAYCFVRVMRETRAGLKARREERERQ